MFGFSAYSETPFSSLPLNKYQLSCEAGSYTLTGSAATFAYTRAVSGNAGSYTITGNDAELTYNQRLEAEAGSYTLTGNSATFVYNQVIYAGAFSFLWTGNDAGLNVSHKLYAEAGSFALTGNNASFARDKLFNCSPGAYSYTGKDATFDYNPTPVAVVESKGGISKKRKTKIDEDREQREQLEAIVKREFDILDGTYVPEAIKAVKQEILPKIQEIDWTEYQIALAQVNALLLQAKIQVAEYESELDDEEALLMLL